MKKIIKGIVYFVIAFAANIMIGPRTMQPVWDLFAAMWEATSSALIIGAILGIPCYMGYLWLRRMNRKSDDVRIINMTEMALKDK